MKRIYRLRKNYQFNYIYRKGKTVGNAFFVLHYVSNGNGKIKIGFSVPKRFGKAVKRNLIKRRLRFMFSQLIPELNNSFNYIVSPRTSAGEVSYEKLRFSLYSLLSKNGVIKGE